MLERKGLISSERTTIYTKKHGARNGNLKYTIHPIKPIADAYFEKQIRKQQAKLAAEEAKAALELEKQLEAQMLTRNYKGFLK